MLLAMEISPARSSWVLATLPPDSATVISSSGSLESTSPMDTQQGKRPELAATAERVRQRVSAGAASPAGAAGVAGAGPLLPAGGLLPPQPDSAASITAADNSSARILFIPIAPFILPSLFRFPSPPPAWERRFL